MQRLFRKRAVDVIGRSVTASKHGPISLVGVGLAAWSHNPVRKGTGLRQWRIRANTKSAWCRCAWAPIPRPNFAAAVEHIREAARRGANIVCLPELFRTQYFCQREDLRSSIWPSRFPGRRPALLGEVARELRRRRSLPRSLSGARRGSTTTPRSRWMPTARSPSVYRKMHIPDDPLYYEKYYFTPGDLGFQAVDTAFGRVGTLVCWDQWYPEGARLTALQGAEVLFYPTAIGWHPAEKAEFGAAQYDAWQTIQRAHAIANGVYVAGVNRVGHENGDMLGNRAPGPGLEFWGGSFLADPFGRIIAKASHEREEILIGEIDLGAD